MKQRNLSLDIIRIFACLLVITCHAPMARQDAHFFVHAATSLFSSPCNMLFFLVSGALLLPAPGTDLKLSTRDFLRKRLNKVLLPTLVWTAFYIVVRILLKKNSLEELPQMVLSIPFSPKGSGVLWFMYSLIGLYLLTPILSAWLRRASEKEERFYLMLWCITLFYPLLEGVLKIDQTYNNILYNFSGYVGYFVLGHYLLHYGSKFRLWHATVLFLIALAAPLAVKVMHIENISGVFINGLSAFVLCYGLFWWTLWRTVANRFTPLRRWQTQLVRLSSMTFGIYLCHIFIMRVGLWNVPFIAALPALQQIVVTIVLTFVISLAVVWLISLTPAGNVVIGYRQRKG